MTRHNTITRFWTLEEDVTLRAFAEKCLPWNKALGLIPKRSAAACQTRWANKLKYLYDINPRKHLDMTEHHGKPDARFRDDRSADGEPISAGYYVFKVPDGDPYLQQLIAVHGGDKINRDVTLKR